MKKKAGLFLSLLLAVVVFIEPVRTFFNGFSYDERKLTEEMKVVGPIMGHNPRVKEAQDILRSIGGAKISSDGFMGGETRTAIKLFQKRQGLKSHGIIDSSTWQALQEEKKVRRETIPEAAVQQEYRDTKSPAIEKEGKEKNLVISGATQDSVRVPVKIMEIQRALKESGFYRGKIDGKVGQQTTHAIVAFQESKGLKADGIIGNKTWDRLREF
ncbi:MAG: peptidoglycan-binding protein [Candidatus Omnitrophica bacterium]|nr:peptidoglycan-binding protein [Candidatus Omnitrophota bacterium]